MTLEALFWLAVGVGAGVMGTLTVLAIHRWRPRRMEHDRSLERLRRLQNKPAVDAYQAHRRAWL